MATNLTTEASGVGVEYHQREGEATLDVQMLIIKPAICGLGFITNILSLMVFLQPSMRNLSCSVYLATKAVSDFTFLVTVFIVWLTSVDIGIFNTAGVCQIVVFASYLTAFVSIWLVVALTIENLLCVVKPWFVQRSCNARSAKIVTTMIIVLGVAFYHFALWNNGLRRLTRPREGAMFDVIIETNNSSGDSGLSGNRNLVALPTESILIQKMFNDAGTTESIYSKSGSVNLISQSTILVSDKANVLGENLAEKLQPAANDASPLPQLVAQQMGTTPSPGLPERTNVTTYVAEETSQVVCIPLEEFDHLAVAMTYLDSLMTLLVPLIILAIANAAIIVLAMRASRKQRRRDQQNPSQGHGYHQPSGGYSSTSCATLDNIDSENNHNTIPLPGNNKKKVSNASKNGALTPTCNRRSTASLKSQASRFLLAVSITLLLYHIPSHAIRLKYLLFSYSQLDVMLFRPFETLYHAHFAIGFFVYIIFGTNFRRVFLKLTCKK